MTGETLGSRRNEGKPTQRHSNICLDVGSRTPAKYASQVIHVPEENTIANNMLKRPFLSQICLTECLSRVRQPRRAT